MVATAQQAQPTGIPSSNGNGGSGNQPILSTRATKRARIEAETSYFRELAQRLSKDSQYMDALIDTENVQAEEVRVRTEVTRNESQTRTQADQALTDLRRANAAAVRQATNAPQPVNRPWWETAAAFALIALAIVAMAILINSWVTRPVTVPPAPPAQALTSIEEVAAMFGNAIELDELAMQGDVVKYTFKPASHSIQFPPDFQLYAVVRPGWEIRDLDMNLLFRAGERHYFPLKSGAFEAYQVAGR